jgi:hypothetical protein
MNCSEISSWADLIETIATFASIVATTGSGWYWLRASRAPEVPADVRKVVLVDDFFEMSAATTESFATLNKALHGLREGARLNAIAATWTLVVAIALATILVASLTGKLADNRAWPLSCASV